MLRLQDCFQTRTLEESAIFLVSKVTYNPRKAYTQSTDGETFWDFGTKMLSKIKKMRQQLSRKEFEFHLFRKIQRRTKPNKLRDIYLSTWRDKVMDRWLNDCLTIQLHNWFSKDSYAYRVEGVGLDSCIDKVTKAVRQGKYFVRRDITQFFYTIDHDILLGKLRDLVDPDDFLFELLRQRVQFRYEWKDKEEVATIGVPFGSSLACVLANIYLTDLDKDMRKFRVWYFRYADDFLIAGTDAEETARSAKYLDESLAALKMGLKESHKCEVSFKGAEGFDRVKRFKHLGLEFMDDGKVKLSVEKQRKIVNFFKRALARVAKKVQKISSLDEKIALAVEVANEIIHRRIRSAAIVDYYLKHVNDEVQLKNMDRIVTEMVISTILGRRFRKKDFQLVPYKKLREAGLISLVHRNRLHRHGHLQVNFLSMYNERVYNRYIYNMKRREERINYMRLAKKIRRDKSKTTREVGDGISRGEKVQNPVGRSQGQDHQ